MTDSTTPDPSLQGELSIIARAWYNEEFKQALLANPKAIIEQEFGFQYPDDVNVEVIEAQPDVLYIRLPEKPDNADSASVEELTETLSETQGLALAQVIAKSWKDESFKQAFLDNPKGLLSQEFGTSLPDNLTVQLLPQSEQQLTLILPNKPETTTELSDEELEAVSGGLTSAAPTLARIVSAVVGATIGGSTLAGSIAGGVSTYITGKPPW